MLVAMITFPVYLVIGLLEVAFWLLRLLIHGVFYVAHALKFGARVTWNLAREDWARYHHG